jgi:hypothetical protein
MLIPQTRTVVTITFSDGSEPISIDRANDKLIASIYQRMNGNENEPVVIGMPDNWWLGHFTKSMDAGSTAHVIPAAMFRDGLARMKVEVVYV